MVPVGFKPAITGREQPQNQRAATGIGLSVTALPYSFRLSLFKLILLRQTATELLDRWETRVLGSGCKCSTWSVG